LLDAASEEEQRENPRAVMDALQVFDKKLREPLGQKYMGSRSVEDLSADLDAAKPGSKNESVTDANGLPMLPPKSKDAEDSKSPTDKENTVGTDLLYC